MSLDGDSRQAMIEYRIEKAYVALDDAEFLTDSGRYNLAANRLYYALYYAGSALLLKHGIPSKTHAGMITLLHLHFVKTGILTTDEGKLLKVLFELRRESDYEDFIEVQKVDVDEYTPLVRALVEKIVAQIRR